MKEEILDSLHTLERVHQIRILYACEAGSRAYGLASESSDYDVRFIYIAHPEWYLSIDQKRDVIEEPLHDQIDLSGWELTKALQLFRKSNPSMLEWLQSSIVYQQDDDFISQLFDLLPNVFSVKPVMYHYLHMAKRNYKDVINKQTVTVKHYLNVLRPLLACIWMKQYESIPPMQFARMVEDLNLPANLRLNIERIRELKIDACEKEQVGPQPRLQRYMEEQLAFIQEYVEGVTPNDTTITTELDELFRKVLFQTWSSYFYFHSDSL
ncbi:DNA polymerase beta superfamily protein [Pontibacillus yanchengensis]|uniref:Nucleotidyltransferase n=1 Tax=Pontibacillus yanchengensis Y32 TaxID=1385514 RepID=A0A0A2TG27_9BACI|nr:nucleotidyltransferase domain-containing protein [Pontibacillus yanchengensis]KGP73061.1 hypothetical protein N782_07385 [Pontibacillus yanchengensis Y32]